MAVPAAAVPRATGLVLDREAVPMAPTSAAVGRVCTWSCLDARFAVPAVVEPNPAATVPYVTARVVPAVSRPLPTFRLNVFPA